MKTVKLSLIAFLMAFAFAATAQNIAVTSLKTTWGSNAATGAAFDTIKTTAAVYMYTGPVFGNKSIVNITAKATELTGTTAGTLSLEVSQDGTTWAPYYNSKDSIYSLTLTDVATAQVYRWQIQNAGDNYYRVKGVGVSTVSVRFEGTYNAWK